MGVEGKKWEKCSILVTLDWSTKINHVAYTESKSQKRHTVTSKHCDIYIHTCIMRKDTTVCLLTLYDQLHHGLPRLHIEPIILAGLAAVRACHLPGHINNTQYTIVTLHLHAAVRHRRLLIGSRPQDDRLGLP